MHEVIWLPLQAGCTLPSWSGKKFPFSHCLAKAPGKRRITSICPDILCPPCYYPPTIKPAACFIACKKKLSIPCLFIKWGPSRESPTYRASISLLGLFLLWQVEGECRRLGDRTRNWWMVSSYVRCWSCMCVEKPGTCGKGWLLRVYWGEKSSRDIAAWCTTLPGSHCLAVQLGLWWSWINSP